VSFACLQAPLSEASGRGGNDGLTTPSPGRPSLSRASSSGGSVGMRSRSSSRGSMLYQEALPSAKTPVSGSLAEVYMQRRESKRLLQDALPGGKAAFESRPSFFYRPSCTPQPKTERSGSTVSEAGGSRGRQDSWYTSERRGSEDTQLPVGGLPSPGNESGPGGLPPIRRGSTIDLMSRDATRAVVSGRDESPVSSPHRNLEPAGVAATPTAGTPSEQAPAAAPAVDANHN